MSCPDVLTQDVVEAVVQAVMVPRVNQSLVLLVVVVVVVDELKIPVVSVKSVRRMRWHMTLNGVRRCSIFTAVSRVTVRESVASLGVSNARNTATFKKIATICLCRITLYMYMLLVQLQRILFQQKVIFLLTRSPLLLAWLVFLTIFLTMLILVLLLVHLL